MSDWIAHRSGAVTERVTGILLGWLNRRQAACGPVWVVSSRASKAARAGMAGREFPSQYDGCLFMWENLGPEAANANTTPAQTPESGKRPGTGKAQTAPGGE